MFAPDTVRLLSVSPIEAPVTVHVPPVTIAVGAVVSLQMSAPSLYWFRVAAANAFRLATGVEKTFKPYKL